MEHLSHRQPQRHCQVPALPCGVKCFPGKCWLRCPPGWAPKTNLASRRGHIHANWPALNGSWHHRETQTTEKNQVRSPVQSPASAPCHLVTKEMGVWAQSHRTALMCRSQAGIFSSYRLPRVQPHKEKKTPFSNHSLHTDIPCPHMSTRDESQWVHASCRNVEN